VIQPLHTRLSLVHGSSLSHCDLTLDLIDVALGLVTARLYSLATGYLVLGNIVHLGKVILNPVFVISPQEIIHWDEGGAGGVIHHTHLGPLGG
jgi:hypothetical protein